MEPRYGRLYASAVLRPLAEQVIDALGVERGETACDLMCDGATLGVALGVAVGRQGRVVLVDSDAALLQLASGDVSATGCAVSTLTRTGAVVAPHEATADRVASLCTFGFWDGDSLLDLAERVTRRRAAILTWDAAEPPAHEIALTDALRDIGRMESPFLRRCLALPNGNQSARWEPVVLRDVVQFDGIAAYWAAMVLERPILRELNPLPGDEVAAVRSACQRALQRWTAADGTMRIPVRATLWRLQAARPA